VAWAACIEVIRRCQSLLSRWSPGAGGCQRGNAQVATNAVELGKLRRPCRLRAVSTTAWWARVPVSVAVTTDDSNTSKWDRDEPSEARRRAPWAVLMGGRVADALLVGIIAAVISGISAGNPSFWYDEAATISGATRTLPELARLIINSDAAHPFYYLLMHGWFDLVPRDEFWARVPSWVAMGFAAGGLVVLAKLMATRAIAIAAGVIFAILPRVTAAGIEARPYGLTCLAAVWLTVVLVIAVRRARAIIWLLYAVLLTVSVLLNIYLLLMIVVHGYSVDPAERRGEENRAEDPFPARRGRGPVRIRIINGGRSLPTAVSPRSVDGHSASLPTVTVLQVLAPGGARRAARLHWVTRCGGGR
jgi:hypothetical protein